MAPSKALDRRAIVPVVFLALVVAAGLWLPIGDEAANARDATSVDSCTEITEPGRYALIDDVEGGDASPCIEITTGDVVLDGGGHEVAGDGSFGTAGVTVRSLGDRPLTNVTVRNLTASGWDDGIRFISVENGLVADAAAMDNRVGISLLDAHGTRIVGNDARENRLRGISLLESATNNTVANNEATDNDLFGIHLVDAGVRDNVVAANDASNNEFGIALVGANDNEIVDNAANSNRISGVWLSAATANRIADNDVSNRFYGIYLADHSSRNTVSNNTATENQVGVRLRSSDRNAVSDNRIDSSADNAVLLISSDHNVVVGNVGSDNVRGTTVLRSTNNTVEDDRLGD